jgi:putative membrane protein
MMGGFGGMGGWGLFGGLFSLVLIIGLLVGLVFLGIWLWRRFSPAEGTGAWAQPSATRQPSALGVLQARYARGELTREEFQLMQQDLA